MRYAVCMSLIVVCSCSTTSNDTTVTYQPLTKAFIKIDVGRLSNDRLNVSGFAQMNIPNRAAELNEITITKPGVYYADLEIDRPLAMLVEFDEEWFQVFIKPGDTTAIGYYDGDLTFSDEINKYYAAKKKFFSFADARVAMNANVTSRTTFKSFSFKADSITNAELQFLKRYQLPEYFMDYERAEIEYLGLAFKVQMPNYIRMFNAFKDDVPANYFDFLKGVKIDNPKAIASSKYFSFLGEYFLRDVDLRNFSGSARRRVVDSIINKESKLVLSAAVLEVYDKHLVRDTTNTTPDIFITLDPGDTVKDFSLINEIDSVVSMRDFKNSVVYINFWATWCGPCIKDFPEMNKLTSQYKNNKQVTFLNICIQSKYDNWVESAKEHNLGGVNLFAAGKWSNLLMTNFDIRGIPHHVLVDRGNIVLKNHADGPYRIRQQIDSLLEVRR